MLGCGYQPETIFPRDTQEAGEDQGKLIIPRSPLAFILTIVVLILVTNNLNYRCREWFFMGGQHRLCTKLDGQKSPLKRQKDALMLLFLPKQILFSNHSLLLVNRESLEGD
jgi:hypothetical protein